MLLAKLFKKQSSDTNGGLAFKGKLGLLLLVVLVGFLSLQIVNAQDDEKEGIGISPTSFNLSADPGETIEGEFMVFNGGTQPVRYKTYVKDFGVNNEEYDRSFEEPIEGAQSPVSWFNVADQTSELELAPSEQKIIKYSISVPADTVPRGYYAAIFAETLPGEADATGVKRVKRVGALVYLTVNGGTRKEGSLQEFKIANWQYARPITSEVRVKNTGNVHFEVNGELKLKDIFGRTISTAEMRGTILPSTIRKISPSLAVNYPIGLYKVEGNLNFADQSVKLGPDWVLLVSPLGLFLLVTLIVAWVVTIRLWVKRRVQRKK